MRQVDVIPVAGSPKSLAISSDGSMLFVANSEPHTICLFDLVRHQVLRVVQAPAEPCALQLSNDGRRLYTCLRNCYTILGADSASLQFVQRIDLPVDTPSDKGFGVSSLALSADGHTLFACGSFDGVRVISIDAGKQVGAINIEAQDANHFIDKLNLGFQENERLTGLLNTERRMHIKPMFQNPTPHHSSSWANGLTLYDGDRKLLTCDNGSNVQMSDTHSGQNLGMIPVAGGPTGNSAGRFAVSRDGNLAYFVNGVSGAEQLLVLNLAQGGIPMRLFPKSTNSSVAVAISPDGAYVYYLASSAVYRINTMIGGIEGSCDFTQPFYLRSAIK